MTTTRSDNSAARGGSAALDTPVGRLVVTTGGHGVRRVSWRVGASTASPASEVVLERAIIQLSEYFTGRRRDFDVPVDLDALTPASRQVLLTLREVPYGRAVTYAELAERSGTELPARAIGAVMGANPVPILIPCHRVIAADGLGGFSGGPAGQGPETKRWLLEHEGILPPRLI